MQFFMKIGIGVEVKSFLVNKSGQVEEHMLEWGCRCEGICREEVTVGTEKVVAREAQSKIDGMSG